MKVTFQYDVLVPKSELVIGGLIYEDEITEEQAERLKLSWETGKYSFLDADESIRDIYEKTLADAIEMEKQEEYGDLVGTEVSVGNFEYPKEIKGEE